MRLMAPVWYRRSTSGFMKARTTRLIRCGTCITHCSSCCISHHLILQGSDKSLGLNNSLCCWWFLGTRLHFLLQVWTVDNFRCLDGVGIHNHIGITSQPGYKGMPNEATLKLSGALPILHKVLRRWFGTQVESEFFATGKPRIRNITHTTSPIDMQGTSCLVSERHIDHIAGSCSRGRLACKVLHYDRGFRIHRFDVWLGKITR
mmetsp:Transcript_7476/g.20686  ORF Transcript_7476/g.20686 Transcript_7476/m.20686 type:complete len:204 (-) Transcript_7476:57-668(-)